MATGGKTSNQLITFIPFQRRGSQKLSFYQHRQQNALKMVQTVRLLPTQTPSKQTAYLTKHLTVQHKPAARKTTIKDNVGVKPRQSFLSTVQLKSGSGKPCELSNHEKKVPQIIHAPSSSQQLKGHIIHRPVAVRPEVKRIQSVSNASVPSLSGGSLVTSASGGHVRQLQTVATSSVSTIANEILFSSINDATEKVPPSSTMNVSIMKGIPSSVMEQPMTTKEYPSSSLSPMHIANTSYSSGSSNDKPISLNALATTSKSVLEHHNALASCQEVANKNVLTSVEGSLNCLNYNPKMLASSQSANLTKYNKLYGVCNSKESHDSLKMMPSNKVTSENSLASPTCRMNENENSVDMASNNKVDTVLLAETDKKNVGSNLHCNEESRSSESCGLRKRSLSGEKKLTCRECKSEFVTHLAYHTHMVSHVKHDPVRSIQYKNQTVCSFCGKCFIRAFMLKTHMYTHTGEKPFLCPFCKRAFADRSNCRAHTKIHTDTRRIFSCTSCNKSFTQRRYLYKHMVDVCHVPERMLRTGLMSVTCTSGTESSEPSPNKPIINLLSQKNSTEVFNSSPLILKGKLNMNSSDRLKDENFNLPKRSRKQKLVNRDIFLPDSYKLEKRLTVKCMRIDDEYPYLRPMFKEMFSNPNAYLTLCPSQNGDVGNTGIPNHVYQLCLTKPSKVEVSLEDAEAVRAAKLAAAKAWQSRLVNGDFTTDEEDDEDLNEEDRHTSADENDSRELQTKIGNSHKRKRIISSSDSTDFSSDDDFRPYSGAVHWSSGRRRRLKRSVKHVNFKHLRYGTTTEDSDTSASSIVSGKHRSSYSKQKSNTMSKQVGKSIFKRGQQVRKAIQQNVKLQSTNKDDGENKFEDHQLKMSKPRLFGKSAEEGTPAERKEDEKNDNRKSVKKSERFHCVECDLKFHQQTNLVLHIVTNHLQNASFYQRQRFGSEQFVCKYCGKVSSSFRDFIQHVPVHTTDVLEKMAQYVISQSSYSSQKAIRIKKENKLKQEIEEYDYDPRSCIEHWSSKESEPKHNNAPTAVGNKRNKHSFSTVFDSFISSPLKTEAEDLPAKITDRSLHHSVSSSKFTSSQIQDSSMEANADIKPKLTKISKYHDGWVCSRSNNSDGLTISKNRMSSTKVLTNRGAKTELKKNNHSNTGESKEMNLNDLKISVDKSTQCTNTKSSSSSSFMDSFLTYVQKQEAQLKKRMEMHTCDYKTEKVNYKENKINTSNDLENNRRPRKEPANSPASSTTGRAKTVHIAGHADKSEKYLEDGDLNIDSGNNPKSQVSTKQKLFSNDKTISSGRGLNKTAADDKSCDSSSVGQVSFINCSHSVDNLNSSDIIVFGTDSVVNGTDGQSLDELTQLRISKNRNLPVSAVCQVVPVGKESGQIIKTELSEGTTMEETFLDTDSVLNTMLNLGSNIPVKSNCPSSGTKESDVTVSGSSPTMKCKQEQYDSPLKGAEKKSNINKTYPEKSTSYHSKGNKDEFYSEDNSHQKKVCKFVFVKSRYRTQTGKNEMSLVSRSSNVDNSDKPYVPDKHLIPSPHHQRSIRRRVENMSKSSETSDNPSESGNNKDVLPLAGGKIKDACNFAAIDDDVNHLKKPVEVSNICGELNEVSAKSQSVEATKNVKYLSVQNVNVNKCSEALSVQLQDLEGDTDDDNTCDTDDDTGDDVTIECEATLETTPLLSQIVPDLSDDVSLGEDKHVDEMTISCEGTLKSVLVNISIDESNSTGPVLIEDKSAQLPLTTNSGSSLLSNDSESNVSEDMEDLLSHQSDVSLAESQHNHNVRRSGRPRKPKFSTEWYCKNLSSKKHLAVKTLIRQRKNKQLHSHFSPLNVPPSVSQSEKSTFKHLQCSTRKSLRTEKLSKTKTCPCCL